MADTVPQGGIPAEEHPDFQEIFQQAREEMWGQHLDAYQQAATSGNAPAAERIQAQVNRRALERTYTAMQALQDFDAGRGPAIANLGAIDPTATTAELAPSTPAPDTTLDGGQPARRPQMRVPPLPIPREGAPNALMPQTEAERQELQQDARSFATGAGMAALASVPARVAPLVALAGTVLSSPADAQQPTDNRQARIRALEAEIRKREQVLQSYGNRQFPSKVAREAANKVEQDAITAARNERDRLQGTIDDEALRAAAREQADRLAAEWRNTPTATAHPWAPPTAALTGLALGTALANRFSASMVTRYNNNIREVAERWGDAVERANNARLSLDRRRQAIVEARQLQERFNTLREGGPVSHWGGTTMAIAGAEAGMAAPSVVDYLSSAPGSQLRTETLQANDPINNTGNVLSRYGLGAGLGLAAGELASRWPYRGVADPVGFAAETAALAKLRAARGLNAAGALRHPAGAPGSIGGRYRAKDD